MKRFFSVFILIIVVAASVRAQQLQKLIFDEPNTFTVKGIITSDQHQKTDLSYGIPLFSLLIDSNFYNSYCGKADFSKGKITVTLADSIEITASMDKKYQKGVKMILHFVNKGKGMHKIENVVPLGEGTDKVYITAQGTKDWPQYLCRSVLYRPGYGPVGVVLPDNAWHMGFSDFTVNENYSLTALARRDARDKEKTEVDRWAVKLKPGGWAEYYIILDVHQGEWHEGLKMMFQNRYLNDLDSFDTTLFARKDLKWMQHSYLMLLQFAWDKKYYDAGSLRHTFYDDFNEYDKLTGGFDVYTLWPTWPRLGLDQRNQFDMYRDLPGGLKEINRQVDFLHQQGRKYFISYNPWDEGTRREDQMKGLEDILRATNADGVCLDTRGASSKELQAAADRVKPGIIMYSEGMAVPKDMPGIVSGRVHDALVMPPPLNLNKFIKPDFAIFRVLQLADDRLHREIAVAFFNGYGIEINTMRPGRPEWMEDEFRYMGRTTKLLRDNDEVFHNNKWIPLIPAQTDSIWVNLWESDNKLIYTIYSLKPEGFDAGLFEFPGMYKFPSMQMAPPKLHFVDLWNHQELDTINKNGKIFIPAHLEKFDRKYLNTRQEGSTGCIAVFPQIIQTEIRKDSLYFEASEGTHFIISASADYASKQDSFPSGMNIIPLSKLAASKGNKIIVQLFKNKELMDERIVKLVRNKPRLVSFPVKTQIIKKDLPEMVKIPGGNFRFITRRAEGTQEPFIAYPAHEDTSMVQMKPFLMDKYPVTNRQWKTFLKFSKYVPTDSANYLKHWINGEIPPGQELCPVVYVSLEDVLAFCRWARKRLPTEMEWQYAAQGPEMRKYPWGNQMDSTKCNYNLNHPTNVDAYPSGASPFGVEDMIGNVWQITNDIYDNDSYYYDIIRGGSYYHPTQSIWYVTGGPVPADHPEQLLLMGPSIDRNATVGFRCVKDVE